MIGLVMAGGRGSRMEFPAPEKLLLEYEKPIIFHVIDSLNLPANAYEVLPYFLIRHEYFPDGLASAFGGDLTFTISEHYLKLPSDIVSDTLTID